MPREDGLTNSVRKIVRQDVQAALAPFAAALKRVESFLGARGRGRPAGSGAGLGLRVRRAKGERFLERGDASKFKLGQKVSINVGRGSDTGIVKKVDTKTNSVFVKRDGNGKTVKRPARGVSA
jgi:hypothetical protein